MCTLSTLSMCTPMFSITSAAAASLQSISGALQRKLSYNTGCSMEVLMKRVTNPVGNITLPCIAADNHASLKLSPNADQRATFIQAEHRCLQLPSAPVITCSQNTANSKQSACEATNCCPTEKAQPFNLQRIDHSCMGILLRYHQLLQASLNQSEPLLGGRVPRPTHMQQRALQHSYALVTGSGTFANKLRRQQHRS